MICERCGTVFCDDRADQRPEGQPMRYCGRTCRDKRKTPRFPPCTLPGSPKVSYAGPSHAWVYARSLFTHRGRQLQPYKCRHCPYWHLTSQDETVTGRV